MKHKGESKQEEGKPLDYDAGLTLLSKAGKEGELG